MIYAILHGKQRVFYVYLTWYTDYDSGFCNKKFVHCLIFFVAWTNTHSELIQLTLRKLEKKSRKEVKVLETFNWPNKVIVLFTHTGI